MNSLTLLAFAAMGFLVMLAYAVLGAQAVRLIERNGALWLDRICGGALLTLALYRRAAS